MTNKAEKFKGELYKLNKEIKEMRQNKEISETWCMRNLEKEFYKEKNSKKLRISICKNRYFEPNSKGEEIIAQWC